MNLYDATRSSSKPKINRNCVVGILLSSRIVTKKEPVDTGERNLRCNELNESAYKDLGTAVACADRTSVGLFLTTG